MTFLAWFWLMVSAMFFALGEYWSKRFADGPQWSHVGYLLAAYLMSSVIWLPALLQKNHLALVGTVWSVLTMLVTVGMGVVVFSEKLVPVQWVGVLFAVLSIILLNLDSLG